MYKIYIKYVLIYHYNTKRNVCLFLNVTFADTIDKVLSQLYVNGDTHEIADFAG